MRWGERTRGDIIEEFYLDKMIELRDARMMIKEEDVDTAALSAQIDSLEKIFADDLDEDEPSDDMETWVARQREEWKDVTLG